MRSSSLYRWTTTLILGLISIASGTRNGLGQEIRFEQCLVVAPETYEIAVQDTGVIGEMHVTENSHVTKQELIGTLNSETLELELQVAALQLQVAKAEAVDESDIRFAEIVVEETKLQLDAYEGMGKKGDASPLEVRQKRIGWEQAKVRVIQARTAKSQKELKARLALATHDLAIKKLERLRFLSPVDGLVVRMDHRSGEWVSAGTPLLKIVRMDEVRIDFFIDLTDFEPNDLLGKEVEVIPSDRIAAGFVGAITGYSPEVSSTRKIRMSATIKNQKNKQSWVLLPGMNVNLRTTAAGSRAFQK